MKKHSNHDNPESQSQSTGKTGESIRVALSKRWAAWISTFGKFLLPMAILVATLWLATRSTVAQEAGEAETESPAQVEAESEESSGQEEAESTDADAKEDSEEAQAESDESSEEGEEGVTESDDGQGGGETEEQMLRLLTKLVELGENDPNSEDMDRIFEALETASDQLELEMENGGEFNPNVLPATPSPAEETGADPAVVEEESVPASTASPADAARVRPVPARTRPGRAEAANPATPVETQADQNPSNPVQAALAKLAAVTDAVAEPQPEQPVPSFDDDALIKLKLTDNMLDLNYLIDLVGKHNKFNFLYEAKPPAFKKVKMELHGEIHYGELLPLLESLLSFQDYTLVRNDPFVKIAKVDQVKQDPDLAVLSLDEDAAMAPGESIMAKIVEVKYVPLNSATNFLKQFTGKGTMVQIPNTNYLIITEYAYRMNRLLEMLALVDQPGPAVKLAPLNVEHIAAKDAKNQIDKLIKDLTSQPAGPAGKPAPKPAPVRRTTNRQGGQSQANRATPTTTSTPVGKAVPTIYVDDRTNRLLVIGTQEQVGQVEDLLALLDVPFGPEITLEVMQVRYAVVGDAFTQIEKLVRDLKKQKGSPAPTPVRPTPRPQAVNRRAGTERQEAARPTPARPGAGKTESPIVYMDERTNRLLVVGSAEEIEQVRELLGVLDVPNTPVLELATITMEHVIAADVADQVVRLLRDLNKEKASGRAPLVDRRPTPQRQSTQAQNRTPAQGAPARRTLAAAGSLRVGDSGPFLHVDDRGNRVMAVGTREQIIQVEDLLVMLDVPEGSAISMEIIEVRWVMVQDAATQLANLIVDLKRDDPMFIPGRLTNQGGLQARQTPQNRRTQAQRGRRDQRQFGGPLKVGDRGPFLHTDERTNRLLVVGTAQQFREVRELLAILDVPPHEYDKLILEIYQPTYIEAEEARRLLDDLGITNRQEETARSRAQDAGRTRRPQQQPVRNEQQEIESSSLFPPGESNLLPGEEEVEIRVAVQETTNKLFVLATERQQAVIKVIMVDLDQEAEFAKFPVEIFPLENQSPEFIATKLQDLMDATAYDDDAETARRVPGKEGAPTIVALEEIYAIAVHGTPKQRKEIGGIIDKLDRRMAQVLVEAVLVQVSVDDSLSLGVFTQASASVSDTRRVSGISPFGLGALTQTGNAIAGTGATVAFFDDDTIHATLEALATTGNSKVVSMPRILVNDNELGSISSQREEPTTQSTIPPGSDTPIITFSGYVSAGTTLSITPHIGDLESHSLQLEITLDVNNFEGEGSASIPPPQVTNNITTVVTVPEGKTLILGGLTRVVDSVTVYKVPLLGDIPLIGALFRNIARTKDRGVLYVFVKAHIVGREGEDGEDFANLSQLTKEAMEELKKSRKGNEQQSIIPGIPDFDREEEVNVLERFE